MNHFIIFTLVIALCFGFKESFGSTPNTLQLKNQLASRRILQIKCDPNILQIKNQLGANRILTVSCWSNRGETKVVNHAVEFNKIYSFPVKEKGKKRIVWKCELRNQENRSFVTLWTAYRGASIARCGQIREYIADMKGVSLVRNKKPTKQFFAWTK
ncbi:hypothetical protein N665_0406s0002 [Sinapis alba]|nr:hypothetical protein N665_0406s0002 [Sinapis alba]